MALEELPMNIKLNPNNPRFIKLEDLLLLDPGQVLKVSVETE